jgi:hypothetical protein
VDADCDYFPPLGVLGENTQTPSSFYFYQTQTSTLKFEAVNDQTKNLFLLNKELELKFVAMCRYHSN